MVEKSDGPQTPEIGPDALLHFLARQITGQPTPPDFNPHRIPEEGTDGIGDTLHFLTRQVIGSSPDSNVTGKINKEPSNPNHSWRERIRWVTRHAAPFGFLEDDFRKRNGL